MPTDDWRAIVRADVAALPPRRGGDDAETTKLNTDLRLGAFSIVREAARLRRISIPAFVRRAALAMACYDLGLPFSDALREDPRVTNLNGFPIDDAAGTRFGVWEIAALNGEEPRERQ